MFKKYTFNWSAQVPPVRKIPKTTIFYVHKKKTRGGKFYHRAICIGDIPRIDDFSTSHYKYMKNTCKLNKSLRYKSNFIPGGKLCFERWSGRHALSMLWDKIAKLSFVDMNQIHSGNPFSSDREPKHEEIIEPDEVFV